MDLINSLNNPNTLIYIVNSLNGDVQKISTLATEAGTVADSASEMASEASDGVQNAIVLITNVRDTFSAALDAKANVVSLRLVADNVATLTDGLGNVVDTAAALQTRTSNIEATATSLTQRFEVQTSELASVSGKVEAVQTIIQETADGILIGRTDSPFKLRITNNGIEILSGSDPVTYWTNEAQLTPKMLQIPQGGSFSLGNFRWVPRSSGNLSLIYVRGA